MEDTQKRIAKEFDELIKTIQKEKIANGTAEIRDRRTYSNRRITLAITRHPEIKNIMRDIINTKLE